ncbi:A/G-specific adenine glycosylase [Pararhodobacter marinus]|uniref:A/G-specific adenine glycosylase n=1 Tax=Pararhodobacter marinus TaxID=2184063 RepID=UPI00351287E4
MRDGTATRHEAAALLRWYDRAARVLPWRVGPAERAAGERPDPSRVWLSEIMLQQTTVASVKAYFDRFTTRWPDVGALAAAEDAEVMAEGAGLGYYARARNLIACARQVAQAGAFPDTLDGLRALPGVGAYTAAAVAAIAFDRAETVVDGNVERVVSRLFAVQDPLPKSKPTLARLAATLTPERRPGDFAQAMMDLGATVCTPRNPRCADCPLEGFCAARAQGIAAELPRKTPKAPKPTRRGIAYVGFRADGAPLLETRPPKGLLGGMPGWPGTDWSDDPDPAPPIPADWTLLPGVVKHTFTHFHLELTVALAHLPQDAAPERGDFRPGFDPAALPTLMRKVHDHADAASGDLFAPRKRD